MIIVTGMHRSGTSLAALILHDLGVDFGPPNKLYAADDHNADGYLERLEVVDLNSRLITGHSRTSSKLSQIRSQLAYLRRPTQHRIAGRAAKLSPELAELAGSLNELGIKDPRFCHTLPYWQRAAEPYHLVVALRHPSAAAKSLQARNRIPLSVGYQFWQWHMEAVLGHIDDQTLLVRQEALVGPNSALEINRMKRWIGDVAGLVPNGDGKGIVKSALVHQAADDSDVPQETLSLWHRLCETPGWQ